MAKMPKNTRAGRALRRGRTDSFNPANGEPHTRAYLDSPWRKVRHPGRRYTYATAERSSR
jgi:hypothetical protein